jgi:hypothetical protein
MKKAAQAGLDRPSYFTLFPATLLQREGLSCRRFAFGVSLRRNADAVKRQREIRNDKSASVSRTAFHAPTRKEGAHSPSQPREKRSAPHISAIR